MTSSSNLVEDEGLILDKGGRGPRASRINRDGLPTGFFLEVADYIRRRRGALMTGDVITTEQPVLTGGISSVAFFNGRLLTGEDLTREQLATTEARLRVGRVLGSGRGLRLRASRSSRPRT